MKTISKIVTVLFAFSTIFIITITISNKGTTIHNPISDMTATILNDVEPYQTDYVYNENVPSTADKRVLVEGINGLTFTYDGLNYTHLSDASNEVVEIGIGKEGIYNGRLTGYGPDCPGCSVVGNVSCLTRERTRHSLISDGIKYIDASFGSVRILAADNSLFPCGTIIKVDNGILDTFVGIVLDTGYTMRKAWGSGDVWIDLAFSSQAEALVGHATSSNTTYSVQRWGW